MNARPVGTSHVLAHQVSGTSSTCSGSASKGRAADPLPRGPKYPISEDSGPKNSKSLPLMIFKGSGSKKPYPYWLLGPKFLFIGNLDHLGLVCAAKVGYKVTSQNHSYHA